jgi:hypothetical protein
MVVKLRSAADTVTRPWHSAVAFYQRAGDAIKKRSRDALQRGRETVQTVRQSGHIVLIVGWVVLMSLAALFLSGLGAFASVALVLTMGAFSAVTAALTTLMLGGHFGVRHPERRMPALDDSHAQDHPAA